MTRLLAPLVALLFLLPTAAVADEWSYDDARRDVVQVVPGPHGDVAYVERPGDRGADVTRLEVDHDDRRVVVRIHVRDLRRAWIKNVNVRVRTPDREVLALVYQDRQDDGFVSLLDADDFAPVDCPRHPRVRFGFAADLVRLTVPSACLDQPAWVRVGVGFLAQSDDPDEPTMVRDDALRDGEPGREFRLGPRIQPSAHPRPERAPIPESRAGDSWLDSQRVGRRTTDAMWELTVRGRDDVVIEAVHADFDHGVRLLGARFASPDRPLGGIRGPGWPAYEDVVGDTPVVDAVGARLAPTGRTGGWLLMLGYEVTRAGRHHRPAVTVDYRVGREQHSVTFAYEAVICAGKRARHDCASDEPARLVNPAG